MRKEMYKVEFVWINGCKDNILCTSSTMALVIARELFDYEELQDILIYDLQGTYQYLKQNGKITYYYQNLIRE